MSKGSTWVVVMHGIWESIETVLLEYFDLWIQDVGQKVMAVSTANECYSKSSWQMEVVEYT